MSKFSISFFAFLGILCFAQDAVGQGSYYNGVNLELTGLALKDELAAHVVSTHSSFLSYSQVWNVLKSSDLNPDNSQDVLLIYGYNDTDGSIINDRTRSKDVNGGNVGDWNREHVYPKSLGNPNLGTAGPGSDAHHLRSSDVQMNGNRSNLKFADGNGFAGSSNGGWFPGEEWKGDCARMMMFMYLRYGNQCLPSNVGLGSATAVDNNMLNLFLEWNVEDPVSEYELTRNDVIEEAQGNRNPFIDNPALATVIWGGEPANDTWGIIVGIDDIVEEGVTVKIFPNPCTNYLSVQSDESTAIDQIEIFNQVGEKVISTNFSYLIDVSKLNAGYYFLSYIIDGVTETSPFIILESR